MSKINEDADEEQEAEESGEEEDSDSEFADEDIVRGFEEIEADDTSSQGVGRSHFRRSKQFKVSPDSVCASLPCSDLTLINLGHGVSKSLDISNKFEDATR